MKKNGKNIVLKVKRCCLLMVFITGCATPMAYDMSKYNTGNQQLVSQSPMGINITPAHMDIMEVKKIPFKLTGTSWQWLSQNKLMRNECKELFHRKGSYPVAELTVGSETAPMEHATTFYSIHNHATAFQYGYTYNLTLTIYDWTDKSNILFETEVEADTTGTCKYTKIDGSGATQTMMKEIQDRAANNAIAKLVEELEKNRGELKKYYKNYIKWKGNQ